MALRGHTHTADGLAGRDRGLPHKKLSSQQLGGVTEFAVYTLNVQHLRSKVRRSPGDPGPVIEQLRLWERAMGFLPTVLVLTEAQDARNVRLPRYALAALVGRVAMFARDGMAAQQVLLPDGFDDADAAALDFCEFSPAIRVIGGYLEPHASRIQATALFAAMKALAADDAVAPVAGVATLPPLKAFAGDFNLNRLVPTPNQHPSFPYRARPPARLRRPDARPRKLFSRSCWSWD